MTIFKTFKDFLHTGSAEDLKERCAPFLKQAGGIPMYRGYSKSMAGRFGRATEIPVRKDRKPRDTKIMVHNLMNAYLFKKFGSKVRSEAVFCTGDHATTAAYGTPHYVFPVGEFKFVWCEYEGQPVFDTLRISSKIKDTMVNTREADAEKVAFEIMDQFTWRNDDLKYALENEVEIAVLCDSIILIPASSSYEKIIGG